MMRNRVLDELYEIRARILAEHGVNLGEYMRSEFERLKSEGHPIARIQQRNIRYAGTTKFGKAPAEGHGSTPGEP